MIEVLQVIFALWCLFMMGGAAIVMSFMLWQVLLDIFKGGW